MNNWMSSHSIEIDLSGDEEAEEPVFEEVEEVEILVTEEAEMFIHTTIYA